MAKQHQITIHLTDGSRESFYCNADTNIESVRNTLLKEITELKVLTLMTDDKRLVFYPLTSIVKISVSNVDPWQDSQTRFIGVSLASD